MRASNLLYLISSTASASLLSRDNDCDCYLTNGSQPAYFTSHSFFDFRSLSSYASSSPPALLTKQSQNADAGFTSEYFDSDAWANTWSIQNWGNNKGDDKGLSGDATVELINSPNEVYILENDDEDAASDTFLTMRTARLKNLQTASEFESNEDYKFLSVRMLARTVGSPGAITALFTYRHSAELARVQEADIEILTRGPRNKISYTNQPSYTEDGDDLPEATRNASLPSGLEWTDWLVHRLDWMPEASVWYVNGEEVARIEFQTPRDGAQVILNCWSDGGSWSGVMEEGGEAFLQIQWLEMVYNRTETDREEKRAEEGQCGNVCSIDDGARVGQAERVEDGAAVMGLSWLMACLMAMVITSSLS